MAVVALASPALVGAEEPRGLSAEDVAALRMIWDVAVSPDGSQVAYQLLVQRTVGEDENGRSWVELHVLREDGASRPFVIGDVSVRAVEWRPDGGAITFLAKRGEDEHTGIYSIPIDGGEATKLLSYGDGVVEYAWAPDSNRLAFLASPEESEEKTELEEKGFDQQIYEEEWRAVEAWVVDVEDGEAGEPRPLELEGSASGLSWSPAGDRLAVALAPTSLIDDDYMARRVHIVDAASLEVVGEIDHAAKLGSVVWSPDGKHLALLAGADLHDPTSARLWVSPAAGGKPRRLLAGATSDVERVAWSDARTLVWIQAEGVERSVQRMGLDESEPTALLAAGGPIWTELSVSRDGSRASLIGDTAEHPPELFVWDVGEAAPSRASDSNPWLAERRLASQEVVRFRARDGLELEGVLIRPLDAPDGRAPLVLTVHGGPEDHSANGWLTNYSRPGQVLAARGFAVFYPNYRGSTGRGLDFAKTSQGDPAGKEFEDLIDAVDHLVETGLVDRERVGVTGVSYGGYATAWAATFYSDRFAAGVMFVGISDKVSKIGTSDIPNELYLVHARRWPWEDYPLMLERSPIYHVEKARTPLLILGGDADPRVHPSQSLALYRYLKVLGQAPVRYVIYPGEGHGNRMAAARYDYTLRALRWLEHYLLGPGGEPPSHELDYGLEDEAEAEAGKSEAGDR